MTKGDLMRDPCVSDVAIFLQTARLLEDFFVLKILPTVTSYSADQLLDLWFLLHQHPICSICFQWALHDDGSSGMPPF